MPHWFAEDGTIPELDQVISEEPRPGGDLNDALPELGFPETGSSRNESEPSEPDLAASRDGISVGVDRNDAPPQIDEPERKRAANISRKSSAEPEGAKSFAASRGPTAAPKRFVPIKVEPKTFFANERTFIQWFGAALLMVTLSMALLQVRACGAAPQRPPTKVLRLP